MWTTSWFSGEWAYFVLAPPVPGESKLSPVIVRSLASVGTISLETQR